MPTYDCTHDEIVISGISCRLPESNNMEEFQKNLFDGVDMVTVDDRRWQPGLFGLPERSGKLKDINHFDAAFFSVHSKQAECMDPQMRILMETTYESIIDAGYNPIELRDTKTGVYVGIAWSESFQVYIDNPDKIYGYHLTGFTQSQIPNRISYAFDFKGPSCVIDTACSSSMYALNFAYEAIRNGICDSAVVSASCLNLNPNTCIAFGKLGMLSDDGTCKSFDSAAGGYVRSEGIASIFVQKRKDARRVYATIVCSKVNSDGHTEEGITFPSKNKQKELMLDVYKETEISPRDVSYIECHGTGTKVGDPQELNAISDVFCGDRKEPLLIGSVKSNMGHSETVAALASIAKVIITMETGTIPANLHFKNPNTEVPALIDGRLQVVQENTPWKESLVAVNSFGFGGSNGHLLLKANQKLKRLTKIYNNLPRLITVSGRTKTAVEYMLSKIEDHPDDIDLHSLVGSIHKYDIPGHNYRGFSLITKKPIRNTTKSVGKRPIWYIFPGMGSQWTSMAKQLMDIPLIEKSLKKSSEVLKEFNMDLIDILVNGNEGTFDDILNSFVAITAIQIALVDLLKDIGIKPDGYIGHSMGELGCAYVDETISANQTLLLSYWRGKSVVDTELTPGLMASVGLSWEELGGRLPPTIYRACHNSADNVTITGPKEDILKIVKELKSEGVFVKAVNVGGYAFHSKYIQGASEKLLTTTRKIVTSPKRRTNKWISTSIPQSEWHKPYAQVSSADYMVNNLTSPVLFHSALSHVPDNAIVIEIAPHCLFQSILKRSLSPECTVVGLVQRGYSNNVEYLLENIGKIYIAGGQPDVNALYPPNSYPVSRSTPGLSSLIQWDHSNEWLVSNFSGIQFFGDVVEIDIRNEMDSFICDHVIDGRILLPVANYMVIVWHTLTKHYKKTMDKTPVVFEDVVFYREILIPKDDCVKLLVNIQDVSGYFELCNAGSVVASGKVILVQSTDDDDNSDALLQDAGVEDPDLIPLDHDDIYKILRLRGYEYKGVFKGLKNVNGSFTKGSVNWYNNWVAFLDAILHCTILYTKDNNSKTMYVPEKIQKLAINPVKHMSHIGNDNSVPISIDKIANIVRAGGITLYNAVSVLVSRRHKNVDPKMEQCVFVPYENKLDTSDDGGKDMHAALTILIQIILENSESPNIRAAEVVGRNNDAPSILLPFIQKVFISELRSNLNATVFTSESKLETQIENTFNELTIPIIHDNFKFGAKGEMFNLIIMSNVYTNKNSSILLDIVENLDPNGYIILQENVTSQDALNNNNLLIKFGLSIISYQATAHHVFVLLRKIKKVKINDNSLIVKISNNTDFSWIEKLQKAVKGNESKYERIFVLCENANTTGVVGLVKCIRQEPGGSAIRLFFTEGIDEIFRLESRFYRSILEKDLVMNVYKNGKWGSFRHILIDASITSALLKVEHAYINTKTRGNASVCRWYQSDLSIYSPETALPNKEFCHVYYASINFKDVQLAAGRLTANALVPEMQEKECILGVEFSGRDSKGKRVMGIVQSHGLATSVLVDKHLIWEVPIKWSLEEAATVPVVYLIVYYALFVRGRMRGGESILIHAGAGGVGIAAISVALHNKCTVFTTVSSPEKRAFLKSYFPQLEDGQIFNSRDVFFERAIMKKTGGRGVNLVLNSLASDKFQASVRCLAEHGRFLDIGKLVMVKDISLGMSVFLKNTSFHGIHLDRILDDSDDLQMAKMLLDEGISNGSVKPLPVNTFQDDEISQAFRLMAYGKHIGKIVIKIRDEERNTLIAQPEKKMVSAIPKLYMYPHKTYVLLGGLGGFGLELGSWLIERGATKLVLTSRSGIRTGYQSIVVRRWKKEGAIVVISRIDTTTIDGAKQLLEEANRLGPVGGIFNLAVLLKDGLFENLREKDFVAVCGPKINCSMNMDIASRELAPQLDHFVLFSSFSCGVGNAGQSNYGFANSAMERIVENRKSMGYPGLAIQWGVIGDVGIALDALGIHNDSTIIGTTPQRIPSCLNTMEVFLNLPYPVVSSMVIAEKKKTTVDNSQERCLANLIGNVIGIKDPSNISSTLTLTELGADSIMISEINQVLERKFNLNLKAQEIRALTFARIKQIGDKVAGDKQEKHLNKLVKNGELHENDMSKTNKNSTHV